MATKSIKSYYQEEFEVIKSRLRYYTQYGFSPELEPLVKALETAFNEIKRELDKIQSNG